VIMIHGNDEIC